MSDGNLVQFMQRIMKLLDEIDEIKSDVKEVYAEAKSAGYDKAALGAAIRAIRSRAKAETPAAEERAAIVDLYVSAFDNAPRTCVHVPAREATYPERIARRVDHQPAPLLPERDPQSGQHGSDSEGGAGGESPSYRAGSEQESAEQQQARNEPGSRAAASGGGGVKASPETPAFVLPAAKPLRPHCQRPDACAGVGTTHCFTCSQAAARQPEIEEAL